jgi:holin-like protein
MQRTSLQQGLLVIAQICGFWAGSELGYAIVTCAGIPLPGNMVGMVILFVLLTTGILRLEWVEAAATLLLRHLAFFFVPIAVGLMSMGDLLRAHGWRSLRCSSLARRWE